MRLLTVNLWHGRADAADFDAMLGRVRPDLVVAQEVAPDAAEVLVARFTHGLVEGRADSHGRAMVSNQPIDVRSLELPYRPGCVAAVPIDGTAVSVFGVHLANPIDRHEALTRRQQLAELRRSLPVEGPLVVTGDLNSTPMWPLYRRLRRELRDGVADWARREGTRPRRTWGPTAAWPALLRIDHVLVRGVTLTGVDVLPVAGGDHRAVVADMVVAPPEEGPRD